MTGRGFCSYLLSLSRSAIDRSDSLKPSATIRTFRDRRPFDQTRPGLTDKLTFPSNLRSD